MKFTKLLSAALAVLMTVSALSGCSGNNTPDTETNGGADTAGLVGGVPGGGKIFISIYRKCLSATSDPDQVKKVEDKINDYLDEKGKNYVISLSDVGSGEYANKANSAITDKEVNLLWTSVKQNELGTDDLLNQNAAYDITSLLSGTVLYNALNEKLWTASEYNKKNYFIPVCSGSAEGCNLILRQELIDKFDWDTNSVHTLKDIEPFLSDARADGVKYPFLTQNSALFSKVYIDKYDFFTGDVNSNWIAVDRSSNQVVYTVADAEYHEFCMLTAEWGEKGFISDDDVTKSVTDATVKTQNWSVTFWDRMSAYYDLYSVFEQDVVVLPITSRWITQDTALEACYCITSNSSEDQAKACIDFMGLLYTDTVLADLYVYGIEGEDFVYDNEHKVTLTGSGKYVHSANKCAYAAVTTPLYNEPENMCDLYRSFYEGAKVSCASGFRFDASAVERQFNACRNVFDEYGFILENGGIAVADVNGKIFEYQEDLEWVGCQSILAESQKQYDIWK